MYCLYIYILILYYYGYGLVWNSNKINYVSFIMILLWLSIICLFFYMLENSCINNCKLILLKAVRLINKNVYKFIKIRKCD